MTSVWRTSGPWAAVVSLLLVVLLALSDLVLPGFSAFWSEHATFTNLASSLAFVLLTVAVIDLFLERGRSARREAVTLVADNAIARAPIGQRRLMWQLVHGGVFVPNPDFPLPDEVGARLRAARRANGLGEIDENAVMFGDAASPDLVACVAVLATSREWVHVAYDVLRGASYAFRLVIARWSPLMIAGDDSVRVLSELGRQVEELSNLTVMLLPLVRERQQALTDEERADFARRWTRAFANAVALDEALIRPGGERGSRWSTPAANLLSATDRAALGRSSRPELRLYARS